MKPAQFAYHAARSPDEAVAMLAEVAPNDGRVLAGGQSLVPAMALRLAQPAHLVDINGVAAWGRCAVEGDALAIGACVRHADFHKPVANGPLGAALARVVRYIAHYPIRTRGTFCGSIANADPASEWCLVASTVGASMIATSTRGKRTISAADFFQGMLSTALEPDEVLTQVRLPLMSAGTRCGFYEFSRRPGDFAIAMSFVSYGMKGGVIHDPRIGVGGVESRPRRIPQAEAALEGAEPSLRVFTAAAEAAAAALDPMETESEAAEYKRDIARVCVRRALEAAA